MINLYTATTAKSPKRQNAEGIYILEYPLQPDPATLTKMEHLGSVTNNQAEMEIICRALARIRQNCRITIYTDSDYVAAGFTQGWIEKWGKAGWRTAKGKEVSNREKWLEMLGLLNGNAFRFETNKPHQYREWMRLELKKMEVRQNV